MSKAICCDRCRTCFNPNSNVHTDGRLFMQFSNPLFQTSNDYRKGLITGFLAEGTGERKIDLCPDCTTEFLRFMGIDDVSGLKRDKPLIRSA